MKKIYIITLLSYLVALSTIVKAQTPNWLWAKSAGGSRYDNATGVATDAGGNVYVTGFFNSWSIIFGNDTLINANQMVPYSDDIYLVKYNSSGNVIWAKRAGGSSNDADLYYPSYNNIATDVYGNVYITGTFRSSSIIFGNDTLTQSLANGDMFVAKYDSSGNVLWAVSAGGTQFEEAYSIATDIHGNVYVTGAFNSPTITFGSTILTRTGQADMFVVKYDSGGNALWAVTAQLQTNQIAVGYGIATDLNDNVYVTGDWSGTSATFGNITSTGVVGWNIFTAKLDSAGTFLWVNSSGGNDFTHSRCLTVDANSNVYIAGNSVADSLLFDNFNVFNTTYGPDFIVKYNSSGIVQWANDVPGDYDDRQFGMSICNDAIGNIFLTGTYVSKIIFGSDTLNNGTLNYPGMFIAKLDSNGNSLWADSRTNSSGYGINLDAIGNIYLTGSFYNTLILGTTTLTSVAYTDMFVTKFGDMVTGVPALSNSNYQLQIYPNPVSTYTTISFSLPQSEKISIKIFDLTGRLMKTLADGLFHEGENKIEWNATDEKRNAVNAGIYFLKFEVGNYSETKKLSIMK